SPAAAGPPPVRPAQAIAARVAVPKAAAKLAAREVRLVRSQQVRSQQARAQPVHTHGRGSMRMKPRFPKPSQVSARATPVDALPSRCSLSSLCGRVSCGTEGNACQEPVKVDKRYEEQVRRWLHKHTVKTCPKCRVLYALSRPLSFLLFLSFAGVL